jgi:hypothetical protein
LKNKGGLKSAENTRPPRHRRGFAIQTAIYFFYFPHYIAVFRYFAALYYVAALLKGNEPKGETCPCRQDCRNKQT